MLTMVWTGLPFITIKDGGEQVSIEWSWTVALKRGQSSRNIGEIRSREPEEGRTLECVRKKRELEETKGGAGNSMVLTGH